LNEWGTALVGGGGKADHVADNTAAQRNQRGFAFGAVLNQSVKNKVERLPIFVYFPIGQDNAEMGNACLV